MKMIQALKHGFVHYADFRGRSSRAEFWGFIVTTHLLVLLCLMPAFLEFLKFYNFMLHDVRFLDVFMPILSDTGGLGLSESDKMELATVVHELAEEFFAGGFSQLAPTVAGAVMGSLLALVILLPTLSIMVRRLRDAAYSPWWVLPPVCCLLPIPFVGTIASLLSLATFVLCCMPSREPLLPVPPGR